MSSPSNSLRRCSWSTAAATALFAVVALVACSNEDTQRGPVGLDPVGPVGDETGIPGSGNIVGEVRDVGPFAEIVFDSEGAVVVSRTEEASLIIEADDNLMEYLLATVSGNVLEISTTDGVDIAPSKPPIFRIGTRDLAAIDLAGAGAIDVDAAGASHFDVTLSGAGDVTVDPVETGELVLDLHGSGSVSLAGSADQLRATIAGATNLAAANLEVRVATINASASGQAIVWVSDELEVVASDAASVEYYGTPSVTEEVSGAASVVQLGAR